jgi:uncharacterized protein (DUF1697 family)
LLRGVNVGGKNRLPMADLAAMFTEAGCKEVRTYIQSGNVVFSSSPETAKGVPGLISQSITERFGFQVPVVLRTSDEVRRVAADNPFLRAGAKVDTLHVVFLAGKPERRRVDALDAKRSPSDSFVVRGREIFLCLPNGVAGSKLSNSYFDSTLATTSTVRNWRTVGKLIEMTQTIVHKRSSTQSEPDSTE